MIFEKLFLATGVLKLLFVLKVSQFPKDILVSSILPKNEQKISAPVHRGAFCQFLFRWIYYYGRNKSNGKETGKMHLCAVGYTKAKTNIFKFVFWEN